MEYQKIINLLDDETNQPFKFTRRNWFEISDEPRGVYNVNNQSNNNNIRFKTSIIRSNLCDFNDAYIIVKGTISVPNIAEEHQSFLVMFCTGNRQTRGEFRRPASSMIKFLVTA